MRVKMFLPLAACLLAAAALSACCGGDNKLTGKEKAEGWIRKVRETGETMVINLNAADRRVVHKVAQDYSDIETHSEGEGRERKLFISKI